MPFRPVTVINLVAEQTIEYGMLATLAQKKELSQGLLDGQGDLGDIKLKSGRQAFFKRPEQVMLHTPDGTTGRGNGQAEARKASEEADAIEGNNTPVESISQEP